MPEVDVPRLVVGVDGSIQSVAALRWAVATADAADWDVDVVTAWPEPEEAFVHDVPGHFSAPRHRAVAAQDAALEAVRIPAGRSLRVWVENAHPVDLLVARSRGAALLVLGEPREPRVSRPGHVGVAAFCQLLAWCPVVLVGPGLDSPVDARQGPRSPTAQGA